MLSINIRYRFSFILLLSLFAFHNTSANYSQNNISTAWVYINDSKISDDVLYDYSKLISTKQNVFNIAPSLEYVLTFHNERCFQIIKLQFHKTINFNFKLISNLLYFTYPVNDDDRISS